MITQSLRFLGPIALLASLTACGGDAGSTTTNTDLAGHWLQQTGSDQKGMTLEFDSESDKVLVHTAPEEDGSHSHLSGSYSVDADSGSVTVQCPLQGADNGEEWTGALEAGTLTLTAGTETLRFGKSDAPDGH